MKPEQLASSIDGIISKATENFIEGLEKSQVSAYTKLIGLVKELAIDSKGNIKKTAANIKILKGITKSMSDTLLTPKYKQRVGAFIKAYDKIEDEQLTYFQVIKEGYQASAMLEVIKTQAIDSAITALTETGLETYFSQPIKDIIVRNITTGGSYSEFQEELRTFIIGNEEVDGRFLQYTKQITNDSISTYNAQYNQSVSEELGLVFYKYTGTEKDTTREFCRERKNKFFHIEEIKSWGEGEKCCGLSWPSKKEGRAYWPGMRKGTNKSNVMAFRGGYLCMHQLIAVSEGIVPKDVIDRARDAGYLEG